MDGQNPETHEERAQRRSRLENELREILERTDRPPSNVVKFKSRVQRNRMTLRQRLATIRFAGFVTELNVLIAAIVLAVLGFVLGDSSPALGRLLGLLSVGAVVLLFVRYFRRPGQHSVKTWRGRDIDFSPPRRSDWLDKRLGGPRRRR
jgi:hypothetical protein